MTIFFGELSGLGESGLGLFDKRAKRIGLMNGKVGKNLTIKLNTGFIQTVDKLRIGQAMKPGTGINALNPKPPKIALLRASITISILQCFFDPLDSDSIGVIAPALITFGQLDDFFMPRAALNVTRAMIRPPIYTACMI